MSLQDKNTRFRLRKIPSFFPNSLRVSTRLLLAHAVRNASDFTRVVVIVPKNIEALSSHRNRLKRKLSAIVIEQARHTAPLDIVLRVKNNCGLFEEKSVYAKDVQSILHSINSEL